MNPLFALSIGLLLLLAPLATALAEAPDNPMALRALPAGSNNSQQQAAPSPAPRQQQTPATVTSSPTTVDPADHQPALRQPAAIEPAQSSAPASTPGYRGAPVQLQTNSATQQLPEGTLLKLAFQNRLHSSITQPGEPFTAYLADDLRGTYGEVLLPKGTTLRGRVSSVQPSRFFSRGGAMTLTFDHVVLPSGLHQPLDLRLSTLSDVVNDAGVLYTDPGVAAKLSNSVNQGTELFYRWTRTGVETGKELGNGLGMLVTVPATAVGGAVAGTGVAAGKSVYSLVARGEAVVIEPGQIVVAELNQPTSFPVAD